MQGLGFNNSCCNSNRVNNNSNNTHKGGVGRFINDIAHVTHIDCRYVLGKG